MSKEFIIRMYRWFYSDYKNAVNDNEQWEARKHMAKLEKTAMELYGFDFCDSLKDCID